MRRYTLLMRSVHKEVVQAHKLRLLLHFSSCPNLLLGRRLQRIQRTTIACGPLIFNCVSILAASVSSSAMQTRLPARASRGLQKARPCNLVQSRRCLQRAVRCKAAGQQLQMREVRCVCICACFCLLNFNHRLYECMTQFMLP
jgi:hypothetical protein